MTPEIKKTILSALSQHRGDDYERATYAFSRYTPEEMQQQHGRSGRTRQEILDSYRQHVESVDTVIQYIKSI